MKDMKERNKYMVHINPNYEKLQGSYLFSTIAKKVAAYESFHADAKILRLGIGDVTLPIIPSVLRAIHEATDEQGRKETFRGYAPDLGYSFLREVIAKKDFQALGVDIAADEIFVSDGAKSDSGSIQEIFSVDSKIAICDPVYPVYLDSNVMAGRTGVFRPEKGQYDGVLYLPCTKENGFIAEPPKGEADIIYLCFPNNPTGVMATKEQLQGFVDYARKHGAVLIYDAAYEAYITDDTLPHTIYQCEGAEECAIELRSFSKKAGFTGLRLGYTVVPKELKVDGVSLHTLWARRHGTKYNGAPYIIQRAGEAVYSEQGEKEIQEQIAFYRTNANVIRTGLQEAGYEVYGGVHSPYIWLRTPKDMTSWEFFDYLLEECEVVGTPGAGFGPNGEHYFRLTAFGSAETTKAAVERIIAGRK